MYGLGRFQGRAAKLKMLVVIVAVLLLVVAGAVAFLLLRKDDGKKVADESSKAAARIIDKVGELYELPPKEEPVVAAIQDKNKLGDQLFFEKAKNGDYLLVYNDAKIALIYREATDKLINVGPINAESNDSSSSGTQQNASSNP